MTKTEAENVLLRHALEQARGSIEFMHGCLTEPSTRARKYEPIESGGSSYEYPEMTLSGLKDIEALIGPSPDPCFHSGLRHEDCESCARHRQGFIDRAEAKRTLGMESDV